MPTKENDYDDHIAPLVDQVIALCRKHRIGFLMTFHTPNRDFPDQCCTSSILPDDAPEAMYQARATLLQGGEPTPGNTWDQTALVAGPREN